MSFSFCDFFAGWGAGICGLLVGHPADTVKVRQQVAKDPGVMRIIINTLKQEGIPGFYRGMAYPLLLAGAQNSLFFGVYGNTLRSLQRWQHADTTRKTCCEGPLPNKWWHVNVYASGFVAGFVHSFVASPVEFLKIQLQTRAVVETRRQSLALVQDIYACCGIRGFYRGFVSTLWRDVPSFGLYVFIYEHFLCIGRGDDRSNEYPILNQLLAGGMAGTISWISVIPLDVIKSRIQADSLSNPKYKGMIDCSIKCLKKEGPLVFTRGAAVHIVRSFPVNAATFVGYEWTYTAYKTIENTKFL